MLAVDDDFDGGASMRRWIWIVGGVALVGVLVSGGVIAGQQIEAQRHDGNSRSGSSSALCQDALIRRQKAQEIMASTFKPSGSNADVLASFSHQEAKKEAAHQHRNADRDIAIYCR